MKRTVKELKRIARGNLNGNYLRFIQALVMCNIIVSLLEMPFSMLTNEDDFSTQNIIYYVATLLISIVSIVLTAGQYRLHMVLARTGEFHSSELFIPLKDHADRFILTQLLLFGISLLCLSPAFGAIAIFYFYEDILLYIVAVILILISMVLLIYITLNFNLVYFVLNDHEEFTAMQALKYTKQLIFTHRKRYLYLQLSFLGYMLLTVLSLGIALLWIEPYMVQTAVLFYFDVNGELDSVLENRKPPEPTIFNQYV